MSEVKTLVCLANSRKEGERCIAGKSFVDGKVGEWVRPVSGQLGGEVSKGRLRYNDGTDLSVMDIVDVPVLMAVPENHQQENWLLDPDFRLKKRGRITWNQLSDLLDTPDDLWMYSPSERNDRVASGEADKMNDSLRFICVDKLTFFVNWPPRKWGMKFTRKPPQVRAIFEYHGNHYNIVVSDPVCESKYRDQRKGYGIQNEGGNKYEIGQCYVTVSLVDYSKEGNCYYKLAAAVIDEQRASA